jgi:hypothetical protein
MQVTTTVICLIVAPIASAQDEDIQAFEREYLTNAENSNIKRMLIRRILIQNRIFPFSTSYVNGCSRSAPWPPNLYYQYCRNGDVEGVPEGFYFFEAGTQRFVGCWLMNSLDACKDPNS